MSHQCSSHRSSTVERNDFICLVCFNNKVGRVGFKVDETTMMIWMGREIKNITHSKTRQARIGWLVVLGLTALWDSSSVYIGPSPREREKEREMIHKRIKCPNNPPPRPRTYYKGRRPLPKKWLTREKMSKQPPPAPTTGAGGPALLLSKLVVRPDTGSLPSTIAPPDHPQQARKPMRSALSRHIVISLF